MYEYQICKPLSAMVTSTIIIFFLSDKTTMESDNLKDSECAFSHLKTAIHNAHAHSYCPPLSHLTSSHHIFVHQTGIPKTKCLSLPPSYSTFYQPSSALISASEVIPVNTVVEPPPPYRTVAYPHEQIHTNPDPSHSPSSPHDTSNSNVHISSYS